MLSSFRQLFASPVFEDEEKTRTAFLLHVVSLLILGALLMAFIFGPLIATLTGGQTTYFETLSQIISRAGLLIILIGATWGLTRAGYVREASVLFVYGAWVMVAINVYRTGGVQSPAYLNFVLTIVAAGLFLGTQAAVLLAVLSVGVGGGILYLGLQNRLPGYEPLTPTASLLIGGISFSIVTLLLSLYIRRLKEAFAQIQKANEELNTTGKDLEKRILERTRSIEVASIVSRQLTTILDPDQLVLEVVEKVRAAYHYYHVQIYLYEEMEQRLKMVGGTGEAGQLLLERGHTIPLDRGLVGRAARTKKGLLVTDTSKEPDWLPNPLLPDTKAEIVVPILLGDKLIGILDAQNDTVGNVFSEDMELLQSIANQVAIALQNARQYEATQTLFQASQALAGTNEYSSILNTFMKYAAPQSDQAGLLVFESSEDGQLIAADYLASWTRSPELKQPIEVGTRFSPDQIPLIPHLTLGQPLIVADTQAKTPGSQTVSPEIAGVFEQFGVHSAVGLPLVQSGKLLGALLFGYSHPHMFSERELQPVQTLASQLAIIIQNKQLLAETQAALAELDFINRRLTREGWREFSNLVGGVMVEDKAPGQSSKTVNGGASTPEIMVPIAVRGEEIGQFSLQQNDPGQVFSDDDLALLQEVADEVAVALESIRLLEVTQQNALALEESRNLLDSIVENLPLLLFVKEANELRYVRWNKAGEDLLGISANEILGKNAYDSFTKEEADRFTAQDWQILSGESFLDISEETVETPRGTRILHTRKTPVFSLDGQPKYLIGLSEDITERKRTEEAIQALSYRNQVVLDGAGEGILGLDAEGNHTFVNPAAARILGYDVEELIGRPSHIAWHHSKPDGTHYPDEECPIYETLHTGLIQSGEEYFWKKAGEGVPVEYTSTPILEGGQIAGAVVTFRDISERKEAEEIVNRQVAELEILNTVGQILTTQSGLNSMLIQAGEKICEAFNVDTGYIALYDSRSQMIQIPFYLNLGKQVTVEAQPLGVGLVSRVIQTRQPLHISEMTEKLAQDLGAHKIEDNVSASWLGVPILSGADTIGVMCVQHSTETHWFKDSDVRLLSTIASSLSTAVQNIRLFEQTQSTLAELEQLTRRLTREGWQEYLDTMAEEIGYVYNLDHVEPLSSALPSNGNTVLEQSLMVQGEAIGRLVISETETVDYEMTELVTAVSSQLSAHLENLRLLEETERSRQQLRLQSSALESAANAIVITDRRGQVMWVNPAFTVLTGYEAHEAIGGNPRILKSNAQDPEFYRKMWETILDGRVWTGEIVNRRKDKTNYLEEMTITPVRAESGEITHFVAIKTDITKRKEAEDALAKRATELATVADVGTASATLLNPDELLQTVVDLTKSSFGLYHAHIYLFNEMNDVLVLSNGAGEAGHQMVLKGWNIPIDQEKSLVARAARSRKGVIANDVRADPDYLPNPLLPHTRAELAVPLIAGDKVLGVLDVQADQVDYFSEEAMQVQRTLASQIAVALQNARLYVEQAATVQRLRELDHLKSSFLANMSHELRTPLNSIIGFTEIILEGIDGPLTEFMDGDLKIIRKNGKHLLSLINDVLDMAKIEAGRMSLTYERFMLDELLEDVVDITSSLAHDKKLYLKVDSENLNEIELVADRIRLRQVLINLVGNAVKFTETGGVTLHAEKKDGKLWLKVIDTGISVPTDKLETIFDYFSQVDTSTTRKAGGTGLGLPISRRLVELHNGQLFAESSGIEHEGSTFILVLPLERTSPQD